jgi:hypothetical protein
LVQGAPPPSSPSFQKVRPSTSGRRSNTGVVEAGHLHRRLAPVPDAALDQGRGAGPVLHALGKGGEHVGAAHAGVERADPEPPPFRFAGAAQHVEVEAGPRRRVGGGLAAEAGPELGGGQEAAGEQGQGPSVLHGVDPEVEAGLVGQTVQRGFVEAQDLRRRVGRVEGKAAVGEADLLHVGEGVVWPSWATSTLPSACADTAEPRRPAPSMSTQSRPAKPSRISSPALNERRSSPAVP